MIEIYADEKAEERVRNILTNIPGGAEKGIRQGFRAGMITYRAVTKEEDERIYAISPGELASGGRVSVSYYNTSAMITYAGNKIPLFKFTSTPRVPVQRALVWGQQIRLGAGGNFPHAFVARMKSGHVGIFERNTTSPNYDGRLPIKEIQGVASAQMAWRGNVYPKAQEAAQAAYIAEFDNAISRILNGA